jgi:hypothetical protein
LETLDGGGVIDGAVFRIILRDALKKELQTWM